MKMHLEFRHLRTVQTIHEAGGIGQGCGYIKYYPVSIEPLNQRSGGSGWRCFVLAAHQADAIDVSRFAAFATS